MESVYIYIIRPYYSEAYQPCQNNQWLGTEGVKPDNGIELCSNPLKQFLVLARDVLLLGLQKTHMC